MADKGCEFGNYNDLSYRICYGLTEEGKMDYKKPLYEFHAYCKCTNCKRRFSWKQGNVNTLTITTDDMAKFPEIEKLLKKYTCKEDHYIGYKYISFLNGEVKEKICK